MKIEYLICTVFGILLLIHIINTFLPKRYQLIFLKHKSIVLGTLTTEELTLFEWKPLTSIKLFYFRQGRSQEIFHTHRFSAISFLLYSNYQEEFIDVNTKNISRKPRNRSRLIWIAKDSFHQITTSEGCLTLMITGPWGDTYQEYKSDTNELITSTHGRTPIQRILL